MATRHTWTAAQETSNDGMGKRQTLTVGRDRFLVGPWHADPAVAYLTSQPIAGSPTAAGLQRCLELVRQRGYRAVITAALHVAEASAYCQSGFDEFDRLRVLANDLTDLDPPRKVPVAELRIRRARRSDREAALDVDRQAFPTFWRLDSDGLDEALAATSRTRFRIAELNGATVGYSVTGRATAQGFLQRLATSPGHTGNGIGSALVMDSVRWARRRRVARLLVNTQSSNVRALALYEQLGFTLTGTDLVVMTLELT